ncbi:MAG TPA: amino acid adenylation domain-containing protein, partial [Longimicrobium sp.]|nr:amino acid adenylation domain-containing protein [Longimicrobium sp.]
RTWKRGAYEHQDVPFERLVDALRPERTLGHAPLFQVLFQLDDDAGVPSARSAEDEAPEEAARFDLTLVLRAGADGIRGTLQYATDLFDRGTAERMAEHLARVLDQAAADPERPVSRMVLMSPGERAAVAAWNRTEAPYGAERCIHQLFEDQARRTPGAVAVSFGDASLTFAELDARANRLAHHLVRLGVGPEVRVGVCMERGLELLPAILAVMKAGGAWVPADPAHPAERIGYVLEDAGARVVITQARLRSRLPLPAGARVVAVDGEWPRIAAHPADAPRTAATSENLAYVIYTSGSTGRPKGVAMHHRGVVNYIEWGVRHYGAAEGNGSPVFSSMAVDLTITNLLPLFAGRPVRMLPEENAVESLAETLRARPGFGLVKITPVHLSLLTPLLSEAEARAAAHTLVIGADFLAAEPTLFWQDHAPGVRLMNEYGPTETVVGCSAYTLPNGVHRAGPVPVGGPIQNLAFHVLDGALHPVPISLPGELYIGGAGVARGYLGRPALTAEKFVPDPFAAPGARMYRTGDRARWLPSGELMILGRADHQVKIRGYRVELGEIEGVLRGLPGVRDCLLAMREDRPGDRRLVAYVVADSADFADPKVLREMLLERLPEYMVPAAFVRLDAFPQTPTGKLDRQALPPPERDAAGAALEEPASYLEARLIQLWEELLGVDGVGPTQSFFELGGNSLLALRLFAQVRRRLDCELPVSTLFAGGTVRHMAQAIQRQGTEGEADGAVVALQPEGVLAPLFLVHSADRGVMGYVSLVRHLGADQPAWGLRDVGDDMARPLARIAADHVRALRTVRPAGPYHLCGWSFGGYVAFEMALQLQAAGETVAFVGLMDTVAPALDAHWPRERDAELPVILASESAERMRRPFAFDAGTLEGLDPDEQVRRVMAAFRAQGPTPAGFDEAALGAGCRIVRDRYASRAGYAPGRFAGTVTLFRAGTVRPEHAAWLARFGDEERRTLGWCLHADAVEVHEIPGTHATLASEPQVRVLAGRIRDGLARAREAGGAR